MLTLDKTKFPRGKGGLGGGAATECAGASQKQRKNSACKGRDRRLLSPTLFEAPGEPAVWKRQLIMAVRIRMKRVGAKNSPYFRIVVADSRSPRDGKFIEEIGTYQPLKNGDNVKLDLERAKYWVSKGAQPSDTVASFLKTLAKAPAPAA
jgi:small subunit ribosomal protein S16